MILDNLLEQDPEAHVACATLATTGTVIVSGEIRSSGSVDVEKVVKATLNEITFSEDLNLQQKTALTEFINKTIIYE